MRKPRDACMHVTRYLHSLLTQETAPLRPTFEVGDNEGDESSFYVASMNDVAGESTGTIRLGMTNDAADDEISNVNSDDSHEHKL